LFPGQDAYETREASYFDVKQQAITPDCIVQPKSAKERQRGLTRRQNAYGCESLEAVQIRNGHRPYAVGGVGASNIEDGVTLDLKYLSTVVYSAKSKSVQVGPAAR
jgi:hypothetical protein